MSDLVSQPLNAKTLAYWSDRVPGRSMTVTWSRRVSSISAWAAFTARTRPCTSTG